MLGLVSPPGNASAHTHQTQCTCHTRPRNRALYGIAEFVLMFYRECLHYALAVRKFAAGWLAGVSICHLDATLVGMR